MSFGTIYSCKNPLGPKYIGALCIFSLASVLTGWPTGSSVCCGKNKVKKNSSAHSRIWFTCVARVPIMKSSALQINSKTLMLPPSWCWTLIWRVHARNLASWYHTCRLVYNMSLLDCPNKTLLRRAMLCGQTTQAGKRNQHILCRKNRDDVWKN